MRLRAQPISDSQFYPKAAQPKKQIRYAADQPAHHFGIQRVHNIFRQYPDVGVANNPENRKEIPQFSHIISACTAIVYADRLRNFFLFLIEAGP